MGDDCVVISFVVCPAAVRAPDEPPMDLHRKHAQNVLHHLHTGTSTY